MKQENCVETRRNKLIEKVKNLEVLDEAGYRRLVNEIESQTREPGYDEKGRLKVLMFDAKAYDVKSFDEKQNEHIALTTIQAGLDEHSARSAEGYKVICIFVNDKCDENVVEKLASYGVKLIALRCAGFNNVDIQACKKYDIDVVRVPEYSPYAVAEHTLALILALNRQLHRAYIRNRAGYFVIDGLIGFDMRGKTVGVIGTGKIGQCVIEILCGFGCEVLAYDKYPSKTLAENKRVNYVGIDDIWQNSDIITLHVPLFTETYHLIDEHAIKKMKEGVMLVNTSRGGLVDARALIRALKSGKIGSAGLDVYEEEAGIFFNDVSNQVMTDDVLARLMTFGNVIVTSHQAFLTTEALCNIADTTIENIEEFRSGARGNELTNLVQ